MSFDRGATYDYCRVALVFDIHSGEIDGTDVGGLEAAAIADTPKVMTEGNWRLGMFVDEQASDEQMQKLTAVFGGQLGGPMAGLTPGIVWMAFVAGLITIEKLVPSRRVATYAAAGALAALGVLLLVAPDAIPALTIPGTDSMSPMDPMSP